MPQVANVIAIRPRKICRMRLCLWTKSNMKGADFTSKCAGLSLVALLFAGCAHPLDGRIWDARSGQFVAADALLERAGRASHVILRQTHYNPAHHRRQRVELPPP